MVTIKSPAEIKIIKRGGKELSKILEMVVRNARVGASTEQLDALADQLMAEVGGEPAFRGYTVPGSPPFPSVLCISINEEVVHAPATPRRTLHDGDVVGFDIGMRWPRFSGAASHELSASSNHYSVGFFTDMAVTVGIGKASGEARQLMKVTRESLMRGLRVIKPGNLISDIGKEIEQYVKRFGYGVVKDLVGHGVGYAVHEDPPIPNYFDAKMPPVQIQEGMVLAIEPMITLGKGHVKMRSDKWTIVTRDSSPAAHFEVTVVVTKKGYEVATPLPV